MSQIKTLTEATARKLGWIVERGAYQDGGNDLMHRWYTRQEAAETIDRNGRGAATKREALEELRQWINDNRDFGGI